MSNQRLPVTLACWDYDRMRALQDGTVRPEGIDINFLPQMMPEPAFRMLHYGEFEAAEMSLSWYARTMFRDPRPFIALPVFPSRSFRHSSVYINADSGIATPEDLKGRKVGCPEYQMSAAVWIKGILADRYGVPVDSVTYFTGGLEQPGRSEVSMNLPDSIDVLPIPSDRALSEMLDKGEIDALYTAHAPSSYGNGSGRVVRLWDDPKGEEQAYFRDTGIFPIMHVIVVRYDVYQRHRWIAQSLTKAFEESKQLAYAGLHETTALKYMLPWLVQAAEEAVQLMGEDFFPYGLEGSYTTLDTFLRYSYEQHLTPRRLQPEELFAPETIEVAKI